MTEAEFGPWRELSIRQHAEQVSRATGKDLDDAVAESRELLPKMLPAGLATEGMHFFVVVDEAGRELGWLWLGRGRSDPAAGFVYDIIVDADMRGRGYGRAAMVAVERFFQAQGTVRVGLDVFASNGVAHSLYESLGYRAIQIVMTKTLEEPAAQRDQRA